MRKSLFAILSVAFATGILGCSTNTTAEAKPAVVESMKTENIRKERPSRAAIRARVVTRAKMYIGVPYVYGGSTPRGFDCSGYTQYVYKKSGLYIPRVASAQRARAKWINRSHARVGDLVFFHRGSHVYHVGIYAGGNSIWHAPYPSKRVKRERIWTNKISFGRII